MINKKMYNLYIMTQIFKEPIGPQFEQPIWPVPAEKAVFETYAPVAPPAPGTVAPVVGQVALSPNIDNFSTKRNVQFNIGLGSAVLCGVSRLVGVPPEIAG